MNSSSKLRDERGELNVLLIPVILLAVLFIGAAVFAVWAYMSRGDYKNHSDAKVATAVTANTEKVQSDDAKQFAEAAKKPLKPYSGPEAYGSLRVMYPKTWSSYVAIADSSGKPLDAYFHDDFVPSIDMKQTYNLRVSVNASSYSTVLAQYTSLVKNGKATATPYSLPKVKGVVGTRIDGQVVPTDPKATGAMVLLPMRDKTLQIWTESTAYLPDFNNNILPNLSFLP